ncbi:hypothetical protein GQ457_07G022150 [Hibiscus cannabinus]
MNTDNMFRASSRHHRHPQHERRSMSTVPTTLVVYTLVIATVFRDCSKLLTDKCGKHFKRTPSGYLESNGVVCLKDNAKTWITQHFTIVVHQCL